MLQKIDAVCKQKVCSLIENIWLREVNIIVGGCCILKLPNFGRMIVFVVVC